MAGSLRLVLLIFALVCFIVATFGLTNSRVNMTAAGLAFLTASMIFP